MLDKREMERLDGVILLDDEKRLIKKALQGKHFEVGDEQRAAVRLDRRLADDVRLTKKPDYCWEQQTREEMDDNLDGFKIGGMEYGAGEILQAVDPIAFGQWVDDTKEAHREEGVESFCVQIWDTWFYRDQLDYLVSDLD